MNFFNSACTMGTHSRSKFDYEVRKDQKFKITHLQYDQFYKFSPIYELYC